MTRVIGFVGWSGAGKTTLLARLIPALTSQGCSVSTLKHAHHDFDIDQPGKDSHTHRLAGAVEVLVASSKRWALIHELRNAGEPSLQDLLGHLSAVDLVIIEGFKSEDHPKIEVFRPSVEKPLLQPDDHQIIAVASDTTLNLGVPVLRLDDIDAIAAFVRERAVPIYAAGHP